MVVSINEVTPRSSILLISNASFHELKLQTIPFGYPHDFGNPHVSSVNIYKHLHGEMLEHIEHMTSYDFDNVFNRLSHPQIR